jgi:predicted RNase H-like nuclease (RuvC/YqgF family)
MWKHSLSNLSGILFALVLGLFWVPSLYSQSVKDDIIVRLTGYQLILSQAQFSIQNYSNQISEYSKQIQDYQIQLENYKKELVDSSSKSETEIQSIKGNLKKLEIDLALSKQDLEQSQRDLAKQERLYKESLTELNKLKASLTLYHNVVIVSESIVVILGGYLVGNKVLHWW